VPAAGPPGRGPAAVAAAREQDHRYGITEYVPCDAAFGDSVPVRGQPVTVREQRRPAGYAAWERRAERPMLMLALVFLVVLVVPMVADLPPAGRTAFTVADVAIWAAFAVDYVARLYLWWAITTVTTVGYGDRYPTTGTGRLVGGALMLVGIALLGVITASIAAWFVDRLRDVQVAETTTEAALGEVLAELKALHVRLDAIERQPRVVEQAKPSSAPAPLPSQGGQR